MYLGISGRILNKKQTKLENERAEHQANWDKQVNALSLKCYEVQSENLRLANEIRDWVKKYNDIVFAYNKLDADYNTLKNQIAMPDEVPKEEEDTHVEDYGSGE